ncbi:MMPL family transporter [Methylobacter sp. sgz302048]|uniref:MMPL family transporter n=1 Tax=Methylobacter sp. sgz302048 TaxID=3455945 RepID=UPI003FA082C4
MKKVTEVYGQFITNLDSRLLRYPKTLILLVLLLCGFSLYYTARHMGVDADTTDILSKDLQFQKDRERFIKTFPQDDQAILVVVDAKTPEQATQALDYLGAQFSREKQIQSVYIPGSGEFFDRHGLLYPDLKEVQDLAGKMTEAQPFIGALSKDNSLKELWLILGQALTEEAHELPVDLNPMLDKVRLAIRAAIEGKTYQLSWQQMMMGDDNDLLSTRRFVLLKPHLEFNELMPAEKPLAAVRAIADKAEQTFPGVNVRLTGEVVLEHDELATVTYSAEMASAFSFLLVFLSLLIGFRSFKLTLATLSVLTMGLTLTFGFATLAFGNLNLISISFAALYIGIGDDYAVQVCMRYRELLRQNLSRRQALTEAVHRVAPPITLCAITGATGFFSFVPTQYTGVSELGAIAGAGIFISLLITLTVLPAMLKLFPLNSGPAEKKSDHLFPDWVYRFPIEHATLVKWTTAALIVVGLGLLTQARFDINPLNLRDPKSESVVTFRELLKTKDTSPMTLTVMTKNKDEALAMAEKLKQLETVENAITIFDYIPADQEAKLALIEDLSLVMGLQLTSFPPPHQDSIENNMAALEKFRQAIEQHLKAKPDGQLAATLRLLFQEVESLIAVLKSESEPEKKATLDKLQRSLLDTLPQTMNTLLKGLNPGLVTVDTLPRDLAERWLSKDGVYRIQVTPSKDLNDEKNLKAFIKEVRQIAPHATDLPVIYLESGTAIVKAFQQALASAVAAIILVLLFTQRNAKDALLILLPLVTTAILTGVSTVLMDNPFNFANIIVIPILFGLGVDAGINIMSRIRSPEHEDSVLRTGTARGVVFSELTTMCSLISMAFTPHLGLASMGQLLSIGLLLNILCTLIVLPAFAYKTQS